MTRIRSARSLLTQTFWLLVAGMITVQLIISASLFLLPLPREEGVPLAEIAARLGGERSASQRWRPRNVDLPVTILSGPPALQPGLQVSDKLRGELAERLDLPTSQVSLQYRPNSGSSFRYRGRGGKEDGVVRWRGEPFFFDRAIAAAKVDGAWRMVRVADRPFIARWQKRMLLTFGLALLSLLPLAWFFARRLVRPIRAFADAADRVGQDVSAPMIAEDGPKELRVASRAVNAMQGRITEQLREREAMVAAIAHDLRTPLSRIAFRIEGADDSLRESIQRDIEQMKVMISSTVDYVRGAAPQGREENVALDQLLRAIVEDEENVGRPVRWLAEPPDVTIRGSAVALRRLIQNLIDNAVSYGGCAQIRLVAEGERCRVTIGDRGAGLEPESIEAMFAPFARQDGSRNPETGGTGLGLAIARTIARDHGGDVTLSLREGGGMEAVISLPVSG